MNLDLVSLPQAAAIIGVTPARVGRFIAENRIKAEKIGGRYLILKSEVERFRLIPRLPGKPGEKNLKNGNHNRK